MLEECRETLVSALNSFFYIYKDDEEAAFCFWKTWHERCSGCSSAGS